MQNLRDFRPDLRAAIGSLHRSGFDREAYVLAASMEGAYSSALEMVQAIRAAVLRVERALGTEDLPGEARAALQGALMEVTRVMAALAPPAGGRTIGSHRSPTEDAPELVPLTPG